MDPRRLLILTLAGLGLTGCAVFRDARPVVAAPAAAPVVEAIVVAEAPAPAEAFETDRPDAPADTVESMPVADTAVPYESLADRSPAPSRAGGQRANTLANAEARAVSEADVFIGGVRVFAWSPGRVYEVWTAPLKVTTLTLGPGETLVSKAAGDTVRWQIGEVTSGEGAGQRRHVLIKPLQRGLETNLVLTTSRRVLILDLKSGGVDGFNAAVAWDAGGLQEVVPLNVPAEQQVRVPDPAVTPVGPLDAHYAVEPQGRRPRWMPASVFNDGQRTFIAFGADLQIDEAPALFVVAPDGEAQLVNYRQAGGLFIVDRVFDRAELRLGDRRPQVVRIRRLQGAVR